MVSAGRIRVILRRVPILVLASAVLAVSTAAVFHTPAVAQEEQRRGWSLRDLLFLRRSERVGRTEWMEPPRQIQRAGPRKLKARKPRAAPRRPAEPATPIVEKAPDARTVLVVGDFMASGLGEGLDTAFAENTNVKIVVRSNGSSGFVRDDFYNWPEQIKSLIETEKPAAVIVMLGSNDRQQMRVNGEREQPRSEAWTTEYERRTEAFGNAIAAAKVPYLWVGMPAFKAPKMTSDMLAFNDIYRSTAESHGGEFVDIWDGFVDEDGAFVTSGPDINGQPVRLRTDDGIYVSKAGKRKLAFYAEKSLMKILGMTAPTGTPAAYAPAGAPVGAPAPAPMAVDRTVPMLLNDPALDGGSELLGAASPAKADGPGEKLVVEGKGPAASPGRADDFSWPPRGQPAAAAATETTTAITP
ncbi:MULTISPECIES: DUF459 domain-containing protein [unclassified Mesorhizobium]|uniref:SGNH/GDSL hydrolase family protein n=3 Tax=Mesorhizobium TaxID=68287 RepID=UPI000FD4A471|nr:MULTISPECIES: DUF459 domain-containing protein [unclassified Mesorhizobium]RUV28234.1 DUF459 domain-containing protein [Mesorhizobium sp. M5C.F.Ca.IN.020.32.2.1]RWH45663.1 MAG: DUF459 domain-containing protein [Mesorhizobium sp.]RWH60560.1 MAG: DUF459 domain-containing protein [Mesorhizobium sp.]RWI75645.1 MAG: DUF459 domain-containing protein [Mesorhizobium sp.]RWI81090.1 MAG: DUF459 domain-containing protein [Mesorhizobium sp.]